ncbi:MAG: type II secretion system F family protein [Candidatus Heimdallarchaeaceae archaeon]
MKIYDIIFRKTPSRYKEWVKKHLIYSEFTISPERYIGFSIFFGIALGISIGLFLFLLNLVSFTIISITALSLFIIFFVSMNAVLVVVSDNRTKFVDEILPDALRLIASNLKSGLTPDRALLLAARKEFGPLEKQIKKAAKKTIAGDSLEEALRIIPENINSKILERSIDLLREGVLRGGNMSDLLNGLAEDIRQTKILRKEIHAQVTMYIIFIFFAVGIGSPLLFGISSYLVETMKQLGGISDVHQVFSSNLKVMSFQGIKIEPQFLKLYALTSIAITSFFGAILIGLVQEGSEKAGIKFIPILLLISISIFFLARFTVVRLFGVIV